jgi:hypothetical protein
MMKKRVSDYIARTGKERGARMNAYETGTDLPPFIDGKRLAQLMVMYEGNMRYNYRYKDTTAPTHPITPESKVYTYFHSLANHDKVLTFAGLRPLASTVIHKPLDASDLALLQETMPPQLPVTVFATEKKDEPSRLYFLNFIALERATKQVPSYILPLSAKFTTERDAWEHFSQYNHNQAEYTNMYDQVKKLKSEESEKFLWWQRQAPLIIEEMLKNNPRIPMREKDVMNSIYNGMPLSGGDEFKRKLSADQHGVIGAVKNTLWYRDNH